MSKTTMLRHFRNGILGRCIAKLLFTSQSSGLRTSLVRCHCSEELSHSPKNASSYSNGRLIHISEQWDRKRKQRILTGGPDESARRVKTGIIDGNGQLLGNLTPAMSPKNVEMMI